MRLHRMADEQQSAETHARLAASASKLETSAQEQSQSADCRAELAADRTVLGRLLLRSCSLAANAEGRAGKVGYAPPSQGAFSAYQRLPGGGEDWRAGQRDRRVLRVIT
jgi:hypothetical protein